MIKTHKNKADELVTRKILGEEFDKFGKKIDKKIDKKFDEERKKNIAFFASKQDLQESLDNLESRIGVKLDKLVTGTEKLLSKWNTKEQEDMMHRQQHKIVEDRLANHDKRLDKLEKVASLTI